MLCELDIGSIRQHVRLEGAAKTAQQMRDSLRNGEIKYADVTSIRGLYESLVVNRADVDRPSKEPFAGSHVLHESLSEEAASFVSVDAFGVVAAQLFFNALTTKYNAADYVVKGLFRKIPSSITQGETFGGISNLETILKPLAFGQVAPTLEPTQDYSRSPAQERKAAIVNITMDMMRGDRTAQIMNTFESLGSGMGLNDELEACATLSNQDYNNTGGAQTYNRTYQNWKNTVYATYFSSIVAGTQPWANLITSNGLVDYNNLNTAWTAIANTLDPYTNWPITIEGKWYLIVPTPLAFTAARIKRSVQFRTGTEATNNSILITAPGDSGFPVDFEVVVSKHLYQILYNAGLVSSAATSYWFFGVPEQAFSWQEMMDIQLNKAIEGAGEMFTRSLAASFKVERVKTSFVFNPRYMTKNTP